MTFTNQNAVTSGTPVTLGFSNTGRTSFSTALVMCEIKSGGSIAEDASTPAVVATPSSSSMTSVVSRTTASFNPPTSLLVAIAVSKSHNQTNLNITDSLGTLTWTRQATASVGGGYISQIYTAPFTASGNALATPAVVAASVSIPALSIKTSALATPGVVSGSALIGLPSFSTGILFGRSSVGTKRAPGSSVGTGRSPDSTVGEG
jgi:hypothetical protein